MKSPVRFSLGLLALGSMFAFAGCGDDDDDSSAGTAGKGGEAHAQGGEAHGGQGGASTEAGVSECKVIGELCHEADTGTGAGHECHELGHEADGAACLAGLAGCVETCVEGSAGKEPRCAALGELCHAVDDENGPLHECHELGHVNDAAQCAAEFDHCAQICLAARELLEEPEAAAGAGGGGAGGVSAAGGVGGAAGSR